MIVGDGSADDGGAVDEGAADEGAADEGAAGRRALELADGGTAAGGMFTALCSTVSAVDAVCGRSVGTPRGTGSAAAGGAFNGGVIDGGAGGASAR
jgi:colicin import membrane protein